MYVILTVSSFAHMSVTEVLIYQIKCFCVFTSVLKHLSVEYVYISCLKMLTLTYFIDEMVKFNLYM